MLRATGPSLLTANAFKPFLLIGGLKLQKVTSFVNEKEHVVKLNWYIAPGAVEKFKIDIYRSTKRIE